MSYGKYTKKPKYRRRINWKRLIFFIMILLIFILVIVLIASSCGTTKEKNFPFDTASPTIASEATPSPVPQPAIEKSSEDALEIRTKLNLNGKDIETYSRPDPIEFGEGAEYSSVNGVITFRGNNYRDNAIFGEADIKEGRLSEAWNIRTSSLPKGDGKGAWTGAGWTGQPIIVQWPDDIRQMMNLNDEKKNKSGLVEVIYATEDGKVYFTDIDDGKPTRKTLDIGLSFKGSGCIDPRGYPLLYLGAGDKVPAHNGKEAMNAVFMVYSLIDCKRIYTFGQDPDPFAEREWHAYDGAATIDAETDTLIEPAENGIIYTMKLNTNFDRENGTISIEPSEKLKMRFTSKRERDGIENNKYWVGMEDSAVFWKNYMYIADNGGSLLCIDINTMEVMWTQDVLDDTNGSPVFSIEDGKGYLYISTSLHWTADAEQKGDIPVWKIDAQTGKVVWSKSYSCHTREGVSGGVQSTGLLGKNSLDDLVFYTIARTPDLTTGKLIAFDKATGEEKWVFDMPSYTWSSPVAVYSKDGKGYIVTFDSKGMMYLLDGESGNLLDSLQLAKFTIEASPAVYGNRVVIGSRGQVIYGIDIN